MILNMNLPNDVPKSWPNIVLCDWPVFHPNIHQPVQKNHHQYYTISMQLENINMLLFEFTLTCLQPHKPSIMAVAFQSSLV